MRYSDPGDTIAAVSTALGEAGIGIVRISGGRALDIADKVFLSKENKLPSGFKTYTTHYGWIVSQGETIDEVILTVMLSPRSYTKEDIVEINCHGGLIALRAVLELVISCGCRLAEPGEFTRRAFLNGRIDLAQAEAVLDVIRAKTDSALKLGVEQLKGSLSKGISKVRDRLTALLAPLEANIDFPEEQIAEVGSQGLGRELASTEAQLKKIIEDSKRARVLREGIHVVICGKPNAGKSSLLNAILKRERSSVTPVAGTTRDTIEEIIDVQGVPVRIVDTAGILEPRDLVERKAVARSKRSIDAADIAILVLDGSRRLNKDDLMLISRLKAKNVIAAINKIDLRERIERVEVLKKFKHVIGISAKRSENINLLEDEIVNLVCKGEALHPESLLVSNLRHIEAVRSAQKFIAEARNSLDNGLSLEFVAQNIKDALSCLDAILGLEFSEDLLDNIFSNFCIGK